MKNVNEILNSGRIGHAYLFSGAGAYEAAVFFAKKLVEEKKELAHNPNIFSVGLLEEEKEVKIGQIRELKNFMSLTAYSAPYKVAIIKEAEKMNKNAANALLKMLEEPSESGVLILVSDSSNSLLPTILSRVQKVSFRGEKSIDNAKEKLYDLHKIINSGISDRLGIVEAIAKKENLPETLDVWLSYFHDLLRAKAGCEECVKNDFFIENINKIKDKYSQEKILDLLEKILETSGLIKNTNVNARLALENLVLAF